MWLIFVAVIFYKILCILSIPQRCETLSVNTESSDDDYPYKLHFNMTVVQQNQTNLVTVHPYNISINSGSKLCFGNREFPCFQNFSSSFTFTTNNDTFGISVWGADGWNGRIMYQGVIDEASFSGITGKTFTPEEPCDSRFGCNYTCTSFQPIKQAPADTPKCNHSRQIIYHTNNYTIYVTLEMDIALKFSNSGYDLYFNYSFPYHNFSFYYQENDEGIFGRNDGSALNGSSVYHAPRQGVLNYQATDCKQILTVTFQSYSENVYRIVPIGRLILRDGISMMEEGIPFTPANNCFYLTAKEAYSYSQLCCTEFA